MENLSSLKYVTTYRVGWNEETRYQPEFFVAFLTPLLSCPNLRNSLTTLSLKVPPDKLGKLHCLELPHLQNLELHLFTGDLIPKKIDEYLEGFVLFVHNLYRSLKSLSITSTRDSIFLDLTHFFTILGHFPLLRGFSLSIPFDGSHLSDPLALQDFLAEHAHSLEQIQLKASSITARNVPLDRDSKAWIQQTLGTLDELPALRSLQLALRPLKADLTGLHDLLRALAPQLESLTLTDRSLTYDEVRGIVRPFIHQDSTSCAVQLRQLGLRVKYFSPELMGLLYRSLPDLRVLELTFTEVISTEGGRMERGRDSELVRSCTLPCLRILSAPFLQSALVARMRDCRYPKWHLTQMAIPESKITGFQWLDKLEKCLVDCIPGLSIRELHFEQ